jgi:hypothetical protein
MQRKNSAFCTGLTIYSFIPASSTARGRPSLRARSLAITRAIGRHNDFRQGPCADTTHKRKTL